MSLSEGDLDHMDHCPDAKKSALSQGGPWGKQKGRVIVIANGYGTMRAL